MLCNHTKHEVLFAVQFLHLDVNKLQETYLSEKNIRTY